MKQPQQQPHQPQQQQQDNIYGFDAISLSVASPEQILSWSHGEVKKAETINYRTQKPERDGLFCERIFGPTKNWECYCGKYKRIRYKGVICEKCGVEVTRAQVRRERMGHIKLAVPVTHIWFLRSTPSRTGLLLDLPIKTIEQVIYFAAYIITHVDEKAKEETRHQLEEEFKTHKKKIQQEFQDKISQVKGNKVKNKQDSKKELDNVQSEMARDIEELVEQHKNAQDDLHHINLCTVLSELEYRDMSMKFGHVFKAGIGAESIREIISNIDLDKELKRLQGELRTASGQKQKKLIKRIKFVGSLIKAEIRPEWMILTVLPVIPPDLRPMVQLDGGRFAASDLNDLYRRVINRNNRLKKLLSIGAPEVICRNEKRMLQEAVDTLLNNNARTGKAVFNAGDKRKLRSLSDMLKGKQGRFRQNLLGKRVDYSGRSVIVVGPKLKLHQCGLPKIMALELFKPFVIGRLIRDGYAHNIKNAEKLIQGSRPEVWDILEEVTQNYHVLLNRAPTLHRLGIQAFKPILVEGKAIQVHPLVCAAFNADFDGDQMAVHVPLSSAAQTECAELMLASRNLLKPSEGQPVITPTQDMVLGCYYLTKMTDNKKGEGMTFANINEAIAAYRSGYIHLQAKINIRLDGKIVETTVGRLIFNAVIPPEIGFVNRAMDKKSLSKLVGEVFEKCGEEKTAELADHLKRMGFKYATQSGLSIAVSDMTVPPEKENIVSRASEVVKQMNNQYWQGMMTDMERYNHVIKIWAEAKSSITNLMMNTMEEENDIRYMIDSGARGNWGQVTQLCGMKGLVANPAGKTIELPIKSNLKEGFTILEYFIATHGGRKGKSDTALKTAEAGYLTRRLVDAMQDIIIKEADCGTTESHIITMQESNEIGVSFARRIFRRVTTEDIKEPKGKTTIVKKGEEISEETVDTIMEAGIEKVSVRSVITCKTENGICQKCYGHDLGTNKLVQVGTAVGIIAAQSIGEPGTQLTMRTFHMGGVAEGQDITQGLTRVEEVFEARPPKSPAILAEVTGTVSITKRGKHVEIHLTSDEPVEETFEIDQDLIPIVKKGDSVKEKQIIAKTEESKKTFKSPMNGTITAVTDNTITVKSKGQVEHVYNVPGGKAIKVQNGGHTVRGNALTSGHINLRDLMGLTDEQTAQQYIIGEVQAIYTSQGQNIHDKHVEIIARQMLSKVRITDPGDSNLLPGQISNIIQFRNANVELEKKKKKPIRAERLLLGLTRIALYTDSWLSAASFQETIRVLVEASTTKTVDNLDGLKENVIIGKLIPAGATYRKRNAEETAK